MVFFTIYIYDHRCFCFVPVWLNVNISKSVLLFLPRVSLSAWMLYRPVTFSVCLSLSAWTLFRSGTLSVCLSLSASILYRSGTLSVCLSFVCLNALQVWYFFRLSFFCLPVFSTDLVLFCLSFFVCLDALQAWYSFCLSFFCLLKCSTGLVLF